MKVRSTFNVPGSPRTDNGTGMFSKLNATEVSGRLESPCLVPIIKLSYCGIGDLPLIENIHKHIKRKEQVRLCLFPILTFSASGTDSPADENPMGLRVVDAYDREIGFSNPTQKLADRIIDLVDGDVLVTVVLICRDKFAA